MFLLNIELHHGQVNVKYNIVALFRAPDRPAAIVTLIEAEMLLNLGLPPHLTMGVLLEYLMPLQRGLVVKASVPHLAFLQGLVGRLLLRQLLII